MYKSLVTRFGWVLYNSHTQLAKWGRGVHESWLVRVAQQMCETLIKILHMPKVDESAQKSIIESVLELAVKQEQESDSYQLSQLSFSFTAKINPCPTVLIIWHHPRRFHSCTKKDSLTVNFAHSFWNRSMLLKMCHLRMQVLTCSVTLMQPSQPQIQQMCLWC